MKTADTDFVFDVDQHDAPTRQATRGDDARANVTAWWGQALEFFGEMREDFREWRDRQERIASRLGRPEGQVDVDQLDATARILHHDAVATARPALVARIVALVAILATAPATAALAAAWNPWAAWVSHGGPATSDQPIFAWLITHVASTPLLAGLIWAVGYATLIGSVAAVASGARRGFRVWHRRLILAVVSLDVAALAAWYVHSRFGMAAAYVAVGVVIGAWRFFSLASVRQADAVGALNLYQARKVERALRGDHLSAATATTTATA